MNIAQWTNKSGTNHQTATAVHVQLSLPVLGYSFSLSFFSYFARPRIKKERKSFSSPATKLRFWLLYSTLYLLAALVSFFFHFFKYFIAEYNELEIIVSTIDHRPSSSSISLLGFKFALHLHTVDRPDYYRADHFSDKKFVSPQNKDLSHVWQYDIIGPTFKQTFEWKRIFKATKYPTGFVRRVMPSRVAFKKRIVCNQKKDERERRRKYGRKQTRKEFFLFFLFF